MVGVVVVVVVVMVVVVVVVPVAVAVAVVDLFVCLFACLFGGKRDLDQKTRQRTYFTLLHTTITTSQPLQIHGPKETKKLPRTHNLPYQ